VATIDGHNHNLGPYDSPESHEAYARLFAEWRSRPAMIESAKSGVTDSKTAPTISELILAYWAFAEGYYQQDGKPTKELACTRDAVRPLRKLYGSTPAHQLGPKALKAVRAAMIELNLCRNLINQRINRIRRLFKRAVAEELVPASILQGLQAVPALRFGRTATPESEPVKPVPEAWVDLTLPFVSRHVRAMIRL
jgi:hypothetical protein